MADGIDSVLLESFQTRQENIRQHVPTCNGASFWQESERDGPVFDRTQTHLLPFFAVPNVVCCFQTSQCSITPTYTTMSTRDAVLLLIAIGRHWHWSKEVSLLFGDFFLFHQYECSRLLECLRSARVVKTELRDYGCVDR